MSAKAGVLPLKTVSNPGTVTSISGNSANGFTVGVSNPTSTPSITVGTNQTGVLIANGTAVSGTALTSVATQYLDGTGAFSTPASGTGTVTHTVGALTANQLVIGNGGADVQVLGSLGTTTTVLHGNAAGAPTYGAVSLAADVSGILPGANGGTGVANPGKTLTLGGNLTTAGAFASTFTMTNTTGVTFPTSGTLLSTATPVTVAQGGTSLATLTAGNVIIGQGTGTPSFVAPGTAGNVLTSVAGVWASQAPTGGSSGLVLLSTVTASSSAQVDVDTTFSGTYDQYMIVVSGAVVQNNGQNLKIRLKVGGAYDTGSNYGFNTSDLSSSVAAATYNSATTSGGLSSSINIGSLGQSNDPSASGSYLIWITNPASTALIKKIFFKGCYMSSTTAGSDVSGFGFNTATAALTGVRFFCASGNVVSGTFRLYGMVNT